MRQVLGSLGILFGGALVGAVGYVSESIRTGKPDLDQLSIRGRVALMCVARFGTKAVSDLSIARACMAIVNNETGGHPPWVGDATLPGGPSIGPMQVYRKTAIDYGLWQVRGDADVGIDRADYLAKADDLAFGIRIGVAVFHHKLSEVGGDVNEAIRRYNGAGAAAQAYRDRALAFITSTWGGTA